MFYITVGEKNKNKKECHHNCFSSELLLLCTSVACNYSVITNLVEVKCLLELAYKHPCFA